jgi:hypothetical protein
VGATEIQIASEKVKWQLILASGDEKNVDVLKAKNEQRIIELKNIRKSADEMKNLFSSSLSESLKEGDIGASKDVETNELVTTEAIQIYTGKQLYWPDGQTITIIVSTFLAPNLSAKRPPGV